MIHPSDPGLSVASVRDGRVAPVTCAACGCRLQADSADDPSVWTHFSPLGGRDARGCTVDCVTLPHDASGRAMVSTAA